MADYQFFLEVLSSLKFRKIRTILTGFGIMWAMLIFILLQALGAGLYNSMIKKLHAYSGHGMSIRVSHTLTGRINLTEVLTDELAVNLNVFEQITSVFQSSCLTAYRQTVHKSDILGIRIGYEKINHLELADGSFFTERNVLEKQPVCILGVQMKTKLFGNNPAVGNFITIDGAVVYVIGLLETNSFKINNSILIPSSLFKGLFPHHSKSIACIKFTLKPKQNPIKVEEKIRAYLARRLNLAVDDKQALQIDNPYQYAQLFQVLFKVMQGFVWLVSFCFLVTGVVGVANMMLVTVKDRTQELAIRKIMGAQSSNIIGVILLESIVINLISGTLGLGIGISMIQSINRYLVTMIEHYGITHLDFQFSMVCFALIVLVLSGCLAGIIPAKKALNIKPVNALNNE